MSKKDLEKLQASLTSGEISRREFLSATAALGLAATAPGLLMPGQANAAANKGGHFRLGIGGGSTTDSLDPATTTNTWSQNVNNNIYGYLTKIDPESQATPDLAESYDASPDAKTWTVKIRSGVEFHNGKSLTPEDVIASYNHHLGEDSKSAVKALVEQVDSMKVDGDNVVFNLKSGNADWPFIMSDYHIAILPSKDGKVDATSGVGSGPYKLKSFEPGVKAEMERSDNYFDDSVGHFDSLEVLTIADVAARTNALTTGDIDAMDRCDLKTVHLLQRNSDIDIHQVTGTQHYTLPMHTDKAPFDNNDVRLALKYGMDREAILKTVLKGYGAVANDHPISPANPYFNTELEQRQYDPDKAKFHLKKAGLDSLTVDLSTADAAFAGAVDAAVLYKEHAASGAIQLNVVREPNDGYWSNVWTVKPFCFCYWGGRPTEDWMFSTAYSDGAKWNDANWKHDRFNELLLAARAELDTSKRREMYWEMQQICRDEGGTIVPMYASYVFATSKRVKTSDKIASNWDLDGNLCGQRWSFV